MSKCAARFIEPNPTAAEEFANSITHGIGLVLSIAGLAFLLVLAVMRAEVSHVVGGGIFGGTLVFMYAASTLYHSFRARHLKRVLRVVDHIAIYLFIAGTYTPFLLVLFSGPVQWGLLVAVWTMALAGTVFKLFFTGLYDRISTLLYLGMGWMILIALGPLLEVTPLHCLLLIAGGGLFYTGGVAFYLWDRLPYNHAIWHLFVLGGSACHYGAVTVVLTT